MSTYAAFANRLRSIARDIEAIVDEFDELDGCPTAELLAHAGCISDIAEDVEGKRRLDPLPPAQARVLTFVRQFTQEHSWPPTRQEIATALGFKSANGAHEHLKRLAARGVLTLIEGAARGIRLNKRGVVAANTTITTRGSP